MWTNGEAISPVNTDFAVHELAGGEPNNLRRTPDANTRATEDHLAIGLGGAFGWNDEGTRSNIWGYVVEYGDKCSGHELHGERAAAAIRQALRC